MKPQLEQLKQEEKRIKLAEAGGWTKVHQSWTGQKKACIPNDSQILPLPDYFSDLNAVHELVMSQPKEVRSRFRVELQWLITKPCKVSGIQLMNAENYDQWFHATAAQRCEALGLTLKLWKQ
jgi:hypothetical protein